MLVADIARGRRSGAKQKCRRPAGSPEREDRMGTGGGSTAAATTTPVLVGARSAVVRTVAEHHRAVVGFLLGVFLLLLLYTTVFSDSQPQTAIGLLQSSSTPAAARSGQNAGNRPTTSPSSTTSNLTQGNYMNQENNEQKIDTGNKVEEEHVQHDAQRNRTETKLDDERRTKDLVNDASDRMEEELIRKEIDEADSKNRTVTQPAGAQRKPLCDLSDPRFDICNKNQFSLFYSFEWRADGASICSSTCPLKQLTWTRELEQLGTKSNIP